MYDAAVKYTNEYLHGLPAEDLRQLGQEARAMRLAVETQKAQAFGYAERPHLFKKVRRDIARFETQMRRLR